MDPLPSAPLTDPEIDRRRALFDAAGGRFCGVEFVKKDGSLRRMQVPPHGVPVAFRWFP